MYHVLSDSIRKVLKARSRKRRDASTLVNTLLSHQCLFVSHYMLLSILLSSTIQILMKSFSPKIMALSTMSNPELQRSLEWEPTDLRSSSPPNLNAFSPLSNIMVPSKMSNLELLRSLERDAADLKVDSPPNLNALPLEIVENISSFCSADMVDSLMRVRRSLHDACDRQRVWQATVVSGNGRDSSSKHDWSPAL